MLSFSMAVATSLKSMRMTKIPMTTTIVALVLNVILNYIFIGGAARPTAQND
jgi:Na+-driven multidrug efflux pump